MSDKRPFPEGTQSDTAVSPKHFVSPGKGPWSWASDADWNDHRWQLQHRLTTIDQIGVHLKLIPEEEAGIRLSGAKLATAITPYFFNLIERDDPGGPIRRQVIPRIEETHTAPWEMADPCDEEEHSPVPGLVHRYPDRVLFLVTDRCASYCRYCTRSRLVSGAADYDFHPNIEAGLDYIRRHTEVRDVLVSGGDPLLLSDEKLHWLFDRLRAISHVELLRIGTRVPSFLPQRVTPALCATLRKHHPFWISIHTNHPRECTLEMKAACERLADAGIPLGNQSVLLRGVNDDAETMKALLHKLLLMRVRPYYLYQCDLVAGSAHLRSSVSRGLQIIEALRGHTTGYAVPQFVIDAPEGGGKVPINPEYVIYRDQERVVFRNYERRVLEYPEAQFAQHHLPAAWQNEPEAVETPLE